MSNRHTVATRTALDRGDSGSYRERPMPTQRTRAVGALVLALMGSALGACAGAGRSAAWEKPPEEIERPAPVRTAGPEEVRELVERAEEQWHARDQKAAVLEAIRLWERVLEREPKHTRVLTRLSRAHYFLIDAHVENETPPPSDIEQLRLEHHRKGVDAGELALVYLEPEFERIMRESGDFEAAIGHVRPDAVEATFWYCSNLGRFSVAKGRAAKLFYKDRVSLGMERIRELDAQFFFGGADRFLGTFYAEWPKSAGRDLERSEQHFHAAQVLGPRFLDNYVLEAEFLAVERGQRERYVKLLQSVLAAPVGEEPDMAPENRAAQRAARRLLRPTELEERF